MSATGHIIGGPADPDYDGAVLTQDLAPGDTVLHVDDVADFDENAAARDAVLLLDVDFDADGQQSGGSALAYTTCDDDAGTVTLAAVSAVTASAGDRVYLQDPVSGGLVGRVEVLVDIDGGDSTGDPLPAYIDVALLDSAGTIDLTDLAVELDEDEDGLLYVSGFPGLTSQQGRIRFTEDEFIVTTPGDQAFVLSHVPLAHSEHVYWHPAGKAGIYQKASEWSRDRWDVTVPDSDGILEAGDRFVVEYAYTDTAAKTYVTLDDLFAGMGLLGRWDLDETTGTVAHATLGSDGTYINAPTLGQPGLVTDGGKAAKTVSGSLTDITIPIADLPVAGGDPAWVCFWFKFYEHDPFGNVVWRDNTGTSANGYLIDLGETDVTIRNGTVQYVATGVAAAPYLDGNKHMALYNEVGATSYLYLDGVLVLTWPSPGIPFWLHVASPMHFGRNGISSQYNSYAYDLITVGSADVSAEQVAAVWELGRS